MDINTCAFRTIVVCLVICLVEAGAVSHSRTERIASGLGRTLAVISAPSSSSCPRPEDISPCLCLANSDGSFDLNCSGVRREEHLRRILTHQPQFSWPDFRSLVITSNYGLNVLKSGVLGSTSFQQFHLDNGYLQEMQDGALASSYSTATDISLNYQSLQMFPLPDLKFFTSLRTLQVVNNQITHIPPLESQSLEKINVKFNLLGRIAATTFDGLPSLKVILLRGAALTEILPGIIVTPFFRVSRFEYSRI